MVDRVESGMFSSGRKASKSGDSHLFKRPKRLAVPVFRSSVVALIALLIGHASAFAEFSAPERITDASLKYQLSRTADNIMAFDSEGALHVAYWSETRQDFSNPAFPSAVYHRAWTPEEGWAAQDQIDHSVSGADPVGGRHPSLAVAPDDTVHLVWHDHRHCTPGGSWIDNIEIYGNSMAAGAAFSSTDTRFTNTNAAHAGDNGYTPKIVSGADGHLSLSWFDFHANNDVADLYLKTSDVNGAFNLSESMASMQMTNWNDRGAAPSFTVPDIAADGNGTRHLVWVAGQGTAVDLYYGTAAPGATSITPTVIATASADFFDPPHIEAAANGDIWIAYGDDTGFQPEDIVLLRRRSGQSGFDAPIKIADASARQFAPDHKIDSQGRVHLVWIDERNGRHVYYGIYNPTRSVLEQETQITETAGQWERPSLALEPRGGVCILFEENLGVVSGAVWFTKSDPPPAAANGSWNLYK